MEINEKPETITPSQLEKLKNWEGIYTHYLDIIPADLKDNLFWYMLSFSSFTDGEKKPYSVRSTVMKPTKEEAFADLVSQLRKLGFVTSSESQQPYQNVKSCLLHDGDNENDYISEGTKIHSGNIEWEIIGFTRTGLILKHVSANILDESKADKEITWQQFQELFQANHIRINGIIEGDNRTLSYCIKAIKHCLEKIDLEAYKAIVESEIEKAKAEIQTLKNAAQAKEEELKKQETAKPDPELIIPEAIKVSEPSKKEKREKKTREKIEKQKTKTSYSYDSADLIKQQQEQKNKSKKVA